LNKRKAAGKPIRFAAAERRFDCCPNLRQGGGPAAAIAGTAAAAVAAPAVMPAMIA
jgi:hypothetical protein